MRSQRSASLNPPCACSTAKTASQPSGKDLPFLRHRSCASLIHCGSTLPVTWRAVSCAQRRPALSVGAQLASRVDQSWRRATEGSHTLRKVVATAWPS
ncbi:hypothetical protein G6F58_013704 [Rhizopus delemar]|nr:hypothetical protein G6F58_013704 [Rhizopus delemar]